MQRERKREIVRIDVYMSVAIGIERIARSVDIV